MKSITLRNYYIRIINHINYINDKTKIQNIDDFSSWI